MGGAVVPHAPLLLPEVSGSAVAERVGDVAEAMRGVDIDATVIILASPHGPESGIYAGRRGDLSAFGRPGVSVETTSADDLAGQLGRTWHMPSVGSRLDHGVVVPVAVGVLQQAAVVAVSVHTIDEGRLLAEAVSAVAAARATKIAFVASAHLGSALSDRAPLGLDPEARALDDDVVENVTNDAAVLNERAPELDGRGSCSAGVLAAFGSLFASRPAHVAGYARPYGVGYLVATVDA